MSEGDRLFNHIDDDLQEESSPLCQDCQPAYFGMKALKYFLFLKDPSDFHPQLAAKQAEDFNQESSHFPARSVSLFAYLP
jgi:hypothetical protein